MKKTLTLFSIIFSVAIFFYPTTSNSNATGSPGGKTGSPNDATNFNISSCTGCHYAGVGTGATITTNIPSSGYIPNQMYMVTATINQSGINKFGFEITAEEANFGSAKTGSWSGFDVEWQYVNNNTALTHTANGTSGSNSKSWTMNWEAPNTGTGAVTFYGSFIAANNDGNNTGDTYHSATLSVNEGFVNSTNNISTEDQIIFNSSTKILESADNSELLVYNMKGKLILTSNEKQTSLSHLSKGVYVIKSKNNSQKILIN